jgi:hypothetical protein
VQFILDRERFTEIQGDDFAFGIERLINQWVYTAAYPLHDVSSHAWSNVFISSINEKPSVGSFVPKSFLFDSCQFFPSFCSVPIQGRTRRFGRFDMLTRNGCLCAGLDYQDTEEPKQLPVYNLYWHVSWKITKLQEHDGGQMRLCVRYLCYSGHLAMP